MKRLAFGILALAMVAVGSLAAPVRADFVNPGFEVPSITTPLDITPASVPSGFGWTVVGNDVLLINTTYGEPSSGVTTFNAHSGNAALDVTGIGNTGPTDGVYQNVATVAGAVYNVSFWVGVASGTDNKYAGPATIDLLVNGTTILAATNSTLTLGSVNWEMFNASFTAAGASTQVAFMNGTPLNTSYAGLDDVSINPAAVPEPTSLALLGCGLSVAALAGWHRSRREV